MYSGDRQDSPCVFRPEFLLSSLLRPVRPVRYCRRGSVIGARQGEEAPTPLEKTASNAGSWTLEKEIVRMAIDRKRFSKR